MRHFLFSPRLGTPPMSSWYWSLTDWYLTFATAERPSVSLAAAAVQARRGPARPEAAVEVSRTSTTDRSFLNCESGVRVTPGAPILRIVSDHSSGLRRSCGGTCLALVRRPGRHVHSRRPPRRPASGGAVPRDSR